jgi:hypothetical protein
MIAVRDTKYLHDRVEEHHERHTEGEHQAASVGGLFHFVAEARGLELL